MIVWNVDPEIFKIGSIAPRYYSLAFVFGFLFAEKYIGSYLKKNGFNSKNVSTLFTYSLVGTILGARLGHCFFYEPAYFLTHPLEIFAIWKGGLASHGAAIGIIVSLMIFSRRVSKRSVLWILDRVVIVVALSGLFIRSGNLMNSEIVGKETDAAWGFVFPRHNDPAGDDQTYPAFLPPGKASGW